MLSAVSSTASFDSNGSEHYQDSVLPISTEDGENQDFVVETGTATSTIGSIPDSAHQTFSNTVYSNASQRNDTVRTELSSQQEGAMSSPDESRNNLFGSMNDTIFSISPNHAAPVIALPRPPVCKVDSPQASSLEKNMTSDELPGVEYCNININNISKNVDNYISFADNALATDVKKGTGLRDAKSPSAALSSLTSAGLDKKLAASKDDESAFLVDELSSSVVVNEGLAAANPLPAAVIVPEQVFLPPASSPRLPKGKHPVNHTYWQPDTFVDDSFGALSTETVGFFAIRGAHGCFLSVTKRPVAHLFPAFGKLLPPLDNKFPVCCNMKTCDSDEEKWILHRLWNGSKWVVAFQNVASRCFMCVEEGGCVYANRPEANQWERFEVELDHSDSENKLVSFKTLKPDGSYLCVVKPREVAKNKKHVNGCEAICDRPYTGAWEKFSLTMIV